MGTVKENYMDGKILRKLTMTHGNKCTDLDTECFAYDKITRVKEKPELKFRQSRGRVGHGEAGFCSGWQSPV